MAEGWGIERSSTAFLHRDTFLPIALRYFPEPMNPHRLTAAALLLLTPIQALAWGHEGHRMVALIAQDHLTPAAAQAVQLLLGHDTMGDVASFADDYRSVHPETAPWHFVDIPLNEKSYNPTRDCPPSSPALANNPDAPRDCVVDRIQYFVTQLKNPTLPATERAFDLRFLIHLVGDIHQPLHTVGEARGGNQIHITQFGAQQCGERQSCNLHALWDEGLIEHKRINEKKYVANLESEITTLKLADKPLGTPIAWANASHRAATEAWAPDGAVINQQYYETEIPVVDRELEFAGLHLAALLNQIFPTQ